MYCCVVDTNVAVVANGAGNTSIDCRIAAVEFLSRIVQAGKVYLDNAGEIQQEYRRHLNPRGQPGVGDRFFLEMLRSNPVIVSRIDLPKGVDGNFLDIPDSIVRSGFDPSDHKFLAVAIRQGVPVCNAVDSDWLEHHLAINEIGVTVNFVCGIEQCRRHQG